MIGLSKPGKLSLARSEMFRAFALKYESTITLVEGGEEGGREGGVVGGKGEGGRGEEGEEEGEREEGAGSLRLYCICV